MPKLLAMVSRVVRYVLMSLLAIAALPSAPAADESPALRPWLERNQVIGEWLSAQPVFDRHGVKFFGGFTAEVWGNVAGGLDTGAVYSGLLDFGTEIDLGEAVGWQGATLSTTWLWLSGRDASVELTGNIFTVSNIAGFETLRMLELWLEQSMFDEKVSLRAGQLAADSEFFISDYGALFLNGTFGWPAVAYMNLPSGGPGYPMGTLGARLALSPAPWFTFQSAVFQGNVFAQDVNRHGFDWSLDASTGFTFFNEAQVRWWQEDAERGLPGYLKVGAWFQTGQYADPLSDATDAGNSGYYAIIDQLLFREPAARPLSDSVNNLDAPPDVETVCQGLGWFQRIAFTPPERNFTGFYLDTGFTYKGLLPGRNRDTAGVAFAFAQLGSGGRAAVSDAGFAPADGEMVLELTYQAVVAPWFVVQPDLQYIINPGASTDAGNALVIGCRASLVF